MKIVLSVFLFSLFFLIACSPKEVDSVEELNRYLLDPEHHLSQKSEINGYSITVTYKPTDLLVHQEIGEETIERPGLDSLQAKYSNYHYFILSLSKNNKEALHQVEGGMDQYSELVQTLSFRMPSYVTLTTSAQDTIPVGDFIMNRTYGLSQSTDLLFVFSKAKSKDKEWLQFNLNEFGLGTGNQRFKFLTKDVERVPKLKFSVSTDTK